MANVCVNILFLYQKVASIYILESVLDGYPDYFTIAQTNDL